MEVIAATIPVALFGLTIFDLTIGAYAQTLTCQGLQTQYDIVPFESWGSLTDQSVKNWWDAHNCNSAVTAAYTCQSLAKNYGIIPFTTWGSLTDPALQNWWNANNCNTAVGESCQSLAQTYGIVPFETWGSLTDLSLKEWWNANNCNGNTLPSPPSTPSKYPTTPSPPTPSPPTPSPPTPAPPTPSTPALVAGWNPQLNYKLLLFYYPWYGNPSVSGRWIHWISTNIQPPADITSNYYPGLGAYDSGDKVGAITQHMEWICATGAGVIVSSWWGQGSNEDNNAQVVLDVAALYGVKVAWHIEPYGGRTAQSVVNDIAYIFNKYGNHPAFYRDPNHSQKALFFVFYSLAIQDWSALDAVSSTSIVFAQTSDESAVAHFGGIYDYGAIDMVSSSKWLSDFCHANGMLWVVGVRPGYLDKRAVPTSVAPNVDRANGQVYDQQWQTALNQTMAGTPDYIGVCSFNEWHEGTMIEPATNTPPTTPDAFVYNTFLGAYGRTDATAETSYIDRTRYWVSQWK